MPAPDRERLLAALAEHGATASRWIEVHDELDSTSTQLRRCLAAGQPPSGAIVVANRQSAGRGRLGRTWLSDTPSHLYLSVAVCLPPPLLDAVARLPLVAGLAAHRALCALAPEVRQLSALKWPNDLLLGGRKVAGVLCELLAECEVAIVGIGLNLRPQRFAGELAATATTLAEHREEPVRPEDLGGAFVAALESGLRAYASVPFSSLVADWTAVAEPFGRAARVGDIAGRTVGLDAEGRLVLQMDDGRLVTVVGGIVEYDPPGF